MLSIADDLTMRISMQRCGRGGKPARMVRFRYSASLACRKNLHKRADTESRTHHKQSRQQDMSWASGARRVLVVARICSLLE